MYQHAPPQIASDNMTQAITGDVLAISKKRAGTSESLHMVLFGGDYLDDGRHICFRLGLAVGDIPLLNNEAETILTHLGAGWCYVHGVPASGHSGDAPARARYTGACSSGNSARGICSP